jgi:hypothetical protein
VPNRTRNAERASTPDYYTRLDPDEFDWPEDFYKRPDEIMYCILYYLLDMGEQEFAGRVTDILEIFGEDHFEFCASLTLERGSDANGDWMILRKSNRERPIQGVALALR